MYIIVGITHGTPHTAHVDGCLYAVHVHVCIHVHVHVCRRTCRYIIQQCTSLGSEFSLVDDVMMRSLSSMNFSTPVENTLP